MIYPEFLKPNDYIGITAPSSGMGHDLEKMNYVFKKIKSLGYRIKVTDNVKSNRLVSSSAKKRAQQLDELVNDKSVKMILSAAGGDFLMEMLPYTNFDNFVKHPKWLQGMSDPSTLLYILPTKYDIATIYGINAGFYNVLEMPKYMKINQQYIKGDLITQKSYNRCQRDITADKFNPVFPDVVYWETPNGDVKVEGRLIGGCIDALRDLIGTSFDTTKEFVEKYKDDGIIWFFDNFALSAEDFYHTLFQMDQAEWFKYTKAVILGRVQFPKAFTYMTYQKALQRIFGKKMPMILEADIGHTTPMMTLINGGYIKVKASNGKGLIKFELK